MKYYTQVLSSALLLLFAHSVKTYAQSFDHAFRMAQESSSGTARYQALGGAFGSLGGDYSSTKQNPAGLGVLHRSEFQTTFQFNSQNSSALWFQNSTETQGKTNFSPGMSFVSAHYDEESGVGLSFGMGASPRHVFSRSYRAVAGTKTPFSLADFAAFITPASLNENDLAWTKDNNPYDKNVAPWLSILGYNAGWTLPQTLGGSSQYVSFFQYGGKPEGPDNSEIDVIEKGSAYDIDFNLAANFHDTFYMGLGVRLATITYRMASVYSEIFDKEDYLSLSNILETNGSGGAVNVGVIYRPTDQLRLGLSYFSPTWYALTDVYYASAESYKVLDVDGNVLDEDKRKIQAETPEGAWDYRLRTPSKWVASASFVLGQLGLISTDLEWAQYKRIRLSDQWGEYQEQNQLIKEYSQSVPTIRVGGELRLTPQISLRGGYSKRFSPWAGTMEPRSNVPLSVGVSESGTVPHYELTEGSQSFSGGLGFRAKSGFYADLAVVFSENNSQVYPFPTRTYSDNTSIQVNPISLTNRNVTTTVTLGYRF